MRKYVQKRSDICVVCGVNSQAECSLYPRNPGVCLYLTKEVSMRNAYLLMYHNDNFYELAPNSTTLFYGRSLKDWKSSKA